MLQPLENQGKGVKYPSQSVTTKRTVGRNVPLSLSLLLVDRVVAEVTISSTRPCFLTANSI
jgi:hypothetical protein